MERKKIIQIAIIVAMFGGSGFILYNGFFSNSNAPAPVPISANVGIGGSAPSGTTAPASGGGGVILPYGGQKFDFSVLKKQNLQYGAVSYPELDPKEVGKYDKTSKTFTDSLIK